MEYLIVIISICLIWAIVIFNLLIRDRNRVLAAWSDIDVQLNRRHDLIPNLTKTVKQYASYERSTINAITELRTQSQLLNDVVEKSKVEFKLGDQLHKLIAIAENYPDLKADRTFLDLQTQLAEVENQIQYARRYYNGAVRNFNTRIDSIPDLLVARCFRFRPARFFVFNESP
jgi:LemA protein